MKKNYWLTRALLLLNFLFAIQIWGQATLPVNAKFSTVTTSGAGTMPTGFTQSGLEGYNGALKFDTAGDWLQLNFSGTASVLTFDVGINNTFPGSIPVDATFTVQESVDGSAWNDLANYSNVPGGKKTISTIAATSKYIRWYYTTKSSGSNISLKNVQLTGTSCTTPTQSFASTSVTKNVGDAAFTNTFTTNSSGTVTYTSSNTGVATVNSSGFVTVGSAGTTTITANTAASGTWCAASLSYTLTVNSLTPTISATPNSLTGFTYTEGSGPSASQSFTVSGSNLTSGITVTAPSNFQVSNDNTAFANSVSLGTSGGTVYTRLISGLSAGSYSGNITLASTGAAAQNVAVSGSVAATVCGANEDFSNIPTTSSGTYLARSWVGSNGTWNATNARTDQTLNGKAITTNGSGSVTSPTIGGGMGILSFNYKRAFTGTGVRTIQVLVNGIKIGSDITVDPNSDAIQSYSFNVNIPGNVQLELKTSGNQITIDDVAWTCFSGSPTPIINVKGNNITIPDGSTATSTNNNTDFGSAIISTNITKTFTIENNGAANLNLDNPAVLLDGNMGFTVLAQPATNPMTGYSNQTFAITFNNATPGTYEDTVMIGSNASNTTVYSYKVKAQVLSPTVNVSHTSLSGFTYPLSEGPSGTQPITITASDLSGDVTVTSSANWEISTNLTYDGANLSPYNEIVLKKTASNTVASNSKIHIRLKSGLPVGVYTGTITISTPGATDQTISLSGEVTPGVPSIRVTGGGSTINNGSTNPVGFNNTLIGTVSLGESQKKDFEIKNEGALPLVINAINLIGTDVTNFTLLNIPPAGTQLSQNETWSFSIRFAPISIGVKDAVVSISNTDTSQNPFTFAIRGTGQFCAGNGETVLAMQGFDGVTDDNLGYSVTNIGTPGSKTGIISGKSATGDRPKTNNFYATQNNGYAVQGNDPNGKVSSGSVFTFDNINTLNYSDITMSVKLAGFSIESTSNGMDCSNIGEICDISDDQKNDRALIEISPDGGTTWYPQAAVVSNQMNVYWSFGSTGGKEGLMDYATNNIPQYFGSTTTVKYNAISIRKLPAVSALKIRISLRNNSDKEMWVIDDIKVTSTGLIPNVWDGNQWSRNTAPISSDKVVIAGNYDSAINGAFQSCQCEIQNGTQLTVSPNNPITVSDWILNNGTVLVKNDAGLVQNNDNNTNSGSGIYKVERDAFMKRLDYTYWSSPVLNQQLKTFSPGTLASRFYTYNESTDLFETTDYNKDFISGKGYAIRAANTNPSPAYATDPVMHNYVFTGTANNAKITFPLSYTAVTNPPTGVHITAGYNLVGNPYPSNIDFRKLYQNNSSKIYHKAYFWTNTNFHLGNQGSNYDGSNYATLNETGGTAAANSDKVPTHYIKVGQGFIVQAKEGTNGTNLEFSNSIRDNGPANTSVFYNRRSSGNKVDRFWLKLATPSGNFNTLLIGYLDDATNGIDQDYDAQLFKLGSDAFYSLLQDEKMIIQGREYPLNNEDVVKLGAKMFENGIHTISLTDKEGIFAGSQTIYLKDNVTGIVTNLSAGSYSFDSQAGVSANRFEIIYKPQTTLAASDSENKGVTVFRKGNDFIVKSMNSKITALEVYDTSGRLIFSDKMNAIERVLPGTIFTNGMYILKIIQSDVISYKKIRY